MVLFEAPEGTFTIDEFMRLPLEGRRWELLDGRVVQMEPHGLHVGGITSNILYALWDYAHASKLGIALGPGCGWRCWPGRETVRVVDVSYSRNETIPADRDKDAHPHWAPDLIVEVHSPFEHLATVLDRITIFLQAGTRLAWFVDTEGKRVLAFRPEAFTTLLNEHDVLADDEIVTGFTMPVAAIFD